MNTYFLGANKYETKLTSNVIPAAITASVLTNNELPMNGDLEK